METQLNRIKLFCLILQILFLLCIMNCKLVVIYLLKCKWLFLPLKCLFPASNGNNKSFISSSSHEEITFGKLSVVGDYESNDLDDNRGRHFYVRGRGRGRGCKNFKPQCHIYRKIGHFAYVCYFRD